MGNVCFYLKKAEESTGKSLIYLQFKYNGRKLLFSFGQTIDPKNWNENKQRVKSNKQTTADGDHSLNDLMDELEELLLASYKKELKNGIPEPSTLKKYLIDFLNQNLKEDDEPTLFKLIDRFINNEIKYKGKNKAKNTIDKYQTVKTHLLDFQVKTKYSVDFETINLDFFYKYLSYLKSIPHKDKDGKTIKVGLAQNTIAKDIQVIKTFMNEAFDLGYTKNVQHKHRKFAASWEDVDAVYLSDKEIIHLYNYDLSKNKRLQEVRDLFVFGCFTGLRFSDYSAVKPENIVRMDSEYFIKIVTKKTGDLVIIPCNPIILKIFERYKDNPNKLPKAVSIQKFNEYVKEACKAAELKEKGRLLDDGDKELWECVSSHTARRSFATNLYLSGYPTIEIMKITGHSTEKAFLKYIKVSKLDAAKRLSAHIKKNWSEMILKVA